MARWKRQPEETYRFAVQTFFERADFLRTLQHWILFYVKDGETRKSVLRQHQQRAIHAILDRCADPSRNRGLIWHTQGSGKTFTLLTAARQILEDRSRFDNATVVLVVDRTELEGQLKGWVERLLGEMQQQDIAVRRANNKTGLQELLDADFRGLIISTIHKFEAIRKDSCTRDNVYVYIDEAHRSVAKDLGIYLMAALPHATIIGFTGTPIARNSQGESTFQIFGAQDEHKYLGKYSIKESIDDETTLPIRYMLAPSELAVPTELLEQEFYKLSAEEDVTDVDELNKVLERAVNLSAFLTPTTILQRLPGLWPSTFRRTCCRWAIRRSWSASTAKPAPKYKRALDKLLPAEWSEAIYTENAADVIDRPLVAQLQLSQRREDDVRKLFTKAAEEPKILIVTDKLLTGYDADVLYCMYLDKPMRDHVLLQAIARVNRPYVDVGGIRKRIGLVVDFVGVLRELKKALQFDSSEVEGVLEDLDVLLADFELKIAAAKETYLGVAEGLGADAKLEQAVFGKFLDPAARKALFAEYKEIEALWEILSPDPKLRDHIESYKRLSALYAAIRNAYAEKVGFVADLAYKTQRLIQDNAVQQGLVRLTKAVTFDVKTLESLRSDDDPDESKVFNLVRGLQKEIDDNQAAAPMLQAFKDRADRVLEDLQSRKTTGIAAMDVIAALAMEKEAALATTAASGLTPRAFAVFYNLQNDVDLAAVGVDPLDLARVADALTTRFPNAMINSDEQQHLRAALYKPLLGLSQEARLRVVDLIVKTLLGEAEA